MLPLAGQHEHHHQTQDSAFDAMQARGKKAMGVDQYVSTHRFLPARDGGRIELLSNSGDPVAVAAIRAHFTELARSFSAGDFSTPAFVHLATVPGTKVMAEKRNAIRYQVVELPRGGGLRIRTRDSAALVAIHEFLAYQRREHRVGQQ
jgi:hypothetical protein